MTNDCFVLYRLEFKGGRASNEEKMLIPDKKHIKFLNYPVYLSDFQHHKYFVERKANKEGNVKLLQKKVIIPMWVKELIDSFCIEQFRANSKINAQEELNEYISDNHLQVGDVISLKNKRPMKVDECCPGNAYKLENVWCDLIRFTCFEAATTLINDPKKLAETKAKPEKNIIKDVTSPAFSTTLAKCVVGPNFNNPEEKDCFKIMFDILDKYEVKYDKEAIIDNANKILQSMAHNIEREEQI